VGSQFLRSCCRSTLGEANMYEFVQVPESEDVNEWIAVNTTDLLEELHLLFEFAQGSEHYKILDDKIKGFPKGYVYRLAQGGKKSKPVVVTAKEYVDQSFAWMEAKVDNPSIFPDEDDHQFLPDFIEEHIKPMYVRMVRLFAILYASLKIALKMGDAEKNLRTSFKHFVYFSLQFDLLPEEKELEPLKAEIAPLLNSYKEDKAAKAA